MNKKYTFNRKERKEVYRLIFSCDDICSGCSNWYGEDVYTTRKIAEKYKDLFENKDINTLLMK